MKKTTLALLLAALALAPSMLLASDHADPLGNKSPEAGITGLFVFPDGDNTVMIFAVRPRLSEGLPYDLEPYEFTIHMDALRSQIDALAEFGHRFAIDGHPTRQDVLLALAARTEAGGLSIAVRDILVRRRRSSLRSVSKWVGCPSG